MCGYKDDVYGHFATRMIDVCLYDMYMSMCQKVVHKDRHNIKFSKRIPTYQILHVATLMFKGTETMHEKIMA